MRLLSIQLWFILLHYVQAAFAAPGPAHTAEPRCVDSLLSVHASATNFDLRGVDVTLPVPPLDKPFTESGTFLIQARFCEPTVRNASRENTLLILSPGATYNSVYWDIPFEPERYSFVRFAAAHGFATLNLARLGNGRSAHPDPLNVVQTPLQAASQVEILRLAREGRITGSGGRRFRTLVGIGHSLSSFLLNGVVATATPGQLQAAIKGQFSHSGPGISTNLTEVVGLLPARQVVPARFRGLASGFLTSHNVSTRSVFYGPSGTFDPRALAFDETTKDLVSTGEIGSRGATVGAAPQFTGDVLTINGADDQFFCDSTACANIQGEAQFYPNAKSVEFGEYSFSMLPGETVTDARPAVIENSGHSLNFHLVAPTFFSSMIDWLARHGF